MFFSTTAHVKDEIASVKALLEANDRLRTIIHGATPQWKGENCESATLLRNVGHVAPIPSAWRALDHCAALTRLYAVYERFVVHELVFEWLAKVPTLYPVYAELPASLKEAHRKGVSRILPRSRQGRYEHLTEEGILRGYLDGISGEASYSLLLEAFVPGDENLRPDPLDQFLGRVGITGAMGWVSESVTMRQFMTQVFGDQDTVRSKLQTFVEYRNDAAHGEVSEILGLEELMKTADFVDSLCSALAECVSRHALLVAVQCKHAVEIARVTEKYSKNVVVVSMNNANIAIGDELTAVGENYCQPVKVLSLEVKDEPRGEIAATEGQEVGIQFDSKIREKASIVRLTR